MMKYSSASFRIHLKLSMTNILPCSIGTDGRLRNYNGIFADATMNTMYVYLRLPIKRDRALFC
jgi:hypothetical protein